MLKSQMIGNKISAARKKSSFSQAQLAEQLFISPQAVGKWERGESLPDIIMLNRLAEILGVDLNFFSESIESMDVKEESLDSVLKASNEEHHKSPDKKQSWNMSNENLVDIDFSGLKNVSEKFSSSNMQACLFKHSDLSGLLLKGNNIVSCDFSSSNISGSHIQGSNLAKNNFQDCKLNDSEFSKSNIEGCDFTSADFTGVLLKSGGFSKNTVVNAVWNTTSFNAMYLGEILFNGLFKDCFFENCAFNGITFQNATLINTFFKNNKRLNRVQFIDCKVDKLTFAFLKNGKADLSGLTLIEDSELNQ